VTSSRSSNRSSPKKKLKVGLSWAMLIFGLVSWALSPFLFPEEPPFVIALSELALIYTAVTALFVEDQD
jgi:hypothetical protein